MSTSRRATRFAAIGAVAAVAVTGLTVAGSSFAAALTAPSSTSPFSTVDAHKNVELTWTAVAGATSYEIQLLDDDNLDVAQHLEATSPIARWTVPVTIPTGEYRWRVRALTGKTPGPWSELNTLVRGWEQAPSTFEATGVTVPTLTWAPMVDASFYEVEVSPVPFGSPLYSVDKTFVCRTEHTTLTPYGVALGGTTFVNPPGDEGSCAFGAESSQAAADAAAKAAADAAAAKAAAAAFAAAAAALAAGSPTATPTVTPTSTATASPSATPTATATAAEEPVSTKYVFAKTYYWRVRGRDGTVDTRPTSFTASPGSCVGPWLKSGVTVEPDTTLGVRKVTVQLPTTPPTAEATPECSLWSKERTFVPRAPSLGVVNTSPTGLSIVPLAAGSSSRTTASPTFSWAPVFGAVYYRFYFSRDRLIGSIDLAAETMGTSFTPYSSLVLGSTTRYWAIQACGGGATEFNDDMCSPVSAPQPISQVSTNPAAPRSFTATPTYLSATWTTGLADRSPAKAYDVRVTNTETGAATTTTTDRVANVLGSGASSLFIPSKTMAEGTYVFDVRPVDESAHLYPWSAPSRPVVIDHTTPVVKITSKGGFADRTPVSLTFSEPVSNVSASTLGVIGANGAKVAGTVAMVSSSQYTFTPKSHWLTGDYLRVWSRGVVDRAAKPVVTSASKVRASMTADSAGLALSFVTGDSTWATKSASDALSRSYRQSVDKSTTPAHASATALVYGTGVSVGVCKSPSSGAVRVYVDGKLRTTAPLFRSWTGCANSVRVMGLPRGLHRVTLVGLSTGGHGAVGIDRISTF